MTAEWAAVSENGSRPACLPQLDALVMAVGCGKASAFDALYRELAGPVYRTVLAVIRDQAQAEEVTQEVLLEIWQAAARFDPARGTGEAWALTIARRRAIDRVRAVVAGTARERHQGELGVPRAREAWDQVSEAVQEILDREQLSYSLQKLTGPQRQVIMLAFYGGHTYAEVAVILGIAVGTVKSRARAGLAALRQTMHTS